MRQALQPNYHRPLRQDQAASVIWHGGWRADNLTVPISGSTATTPVRVRCPGALMRLGALLQIRCSFNRDASVNGTLTIDIVGSNMAVGNSLVTTSTASSTLDGMMEWRVANFDAVTANLVRLTNAMTITGTVTVNATSTFPYLCNDFEVVLTDTHSTGVTLCSYFSVTIISPALMVGAGTQQKLV